MNLLKTFEKISRKNRILLVIAIVVAIALTSFLVLNNKSRKSIDESELKQEVIVESEEEKVMQEENEVFPTQPLLNIPPPDMQRMKRQGCVFDGILNEYSKEAADAIDLVNRSNCYYLHRSIETWLTPPDFEKIAEKMGEIKKERKDVVYGMFIAEAIDTNAIYYDEEGKEFEFNKMCRLGSKNVWGEHTCKPSFEREEYQRYVLYITKRAMDLGVQSFMFGQIYYQDYISKASVGVVLSEMRAYAKSRGLEIVIGAQTNDIENEAYLRQFDFIEGGVGISPEGKIENGPCFSRWWKKEGDWCWALLWNEKFSKKANNVFVHLDWSGIKGDDMNIFASMTQDKRAETLKYLYDYFEKKDIGFIMPMISVLQKENGGCHGKSRKYYSADNAYSCKDEDAINEIIKSGN